MNEFKDDLRLLNSLQIVRKHIFNGACHLLDNANYYQLKEDICEYFDVEFNDVLVVGSGKLGFSIKPQRRYGAFNDESDIDIAVVSTELFQKIWKEAYLYQRSGAYWPKSADFFKYLSEGWIRPDKLPSSKYFSFTEDWWNFFNKLTISERYGPYKIRGGLYQSWFFLQEYQKICVEQCLTEVKT
ncbi:Uncharacterised protein [Zhongshania aliphaticivorans]|uniref:Uncharacterized protein n=1 Tax=Zhongshania aliphaticivorans TaxID=1470434 RepID=A0A5S9N585_9GAMM|nr:hypothetical protein [Zhongshania aliphaticivorans]CAA0081302.1 Uncharacterised protein [Zhongshania aliphaticivorans]CAA0084991.1 Uncharacterised protein [Zhongshania aliphaticivorans]